MAVRDAGAVGTFVDVSRTAQRPAAAAEVAAYRIHARVRGARVLDIGAGDGRLALELARRRALFVVGVDPDPHALAAGRRNARAAGLGAVSFRRGAAQELPFAAGRFDLAVLSWTL